MAAFRICSDGKPVQIIVVGRLSAGVVRELELLPQDAAGLRNRALSEGLELLLGEAVEVLLFGELIPVERLVALEAGVEGAFSWR